MPFDILPTTLIPVTHLHPNPWNPNEQTDAVFNMLSEEILEEGFDHALVVCPLLKDSFEADWPDGDHYRIIGGEHRWRVAVAEGQPELPCIIKHWDEVKQKTQTMRKNMLTGELNRRKFTDLIESLSGLASREELSRLMGFEDQDQMLRKLIKPADPREKSFLDSIMADTERDKHVIDGLSDVINNIFSSFGDTLDQGYMIFAYKGATHLLVLCDDDLFKLVKQVKAKLSSEGGNVTDLMKSALGRLFDES
jgi:hypothetical protein